MPGKSSRTGRTSMQRYFLILQQSLSQEFPRQRMVAIHLPFYSPVMCYISQQAFIFRTPKIQYHHLTSMPHFPSLIFKGFFSTNNFEIYFIVQISMKIHQQSPFLLKTDHFLLTCINSLFLGNLVSFKSHSPLQSVMQTDFFFMQVYQLQVQQDRYFYKNGLKQTMHDGDQKSSPGQEV